MTSSDNAQKFEGELDEEFIVNSTKKELEGACRHFNIKHSGNKTELQERLRDHLSQSAGEMDTNIADEETNIESGSEIGADSDLKTNATNVSEMVSVNEEKAEEEETEVEQAEEEETEGEEEVEEVEEEAKKPKLVQVEKEDYDAQETLFHRMENSEKDWSQWKDAAAEVIELLDNANNKRSERNLMLAIQTMMRIADLRLLSNLGPTALKHMKQNDGNHSEVKKAIKIVEKLVEGTQKIPVNRPIRPRPFS